MNYFLRLSCFAFMFGVYLAIEDIFTFLPHPRPPTPKCPPNEVFKICLSNCSNCDQRGFCIIRECLENGCDCLPHFVRLKPGGPCVPVNMCPAPECGENEVFRECGPICERCGTFNCRMIHCEHRCYCKEGYKRDPEGKCVPEDECPPKTRCPRGEELRDSGLEDEYCLHEEGDVVSNTTRNVTNCYCAEGLKRNGFGHCIEEKYCHVVKCLGVETYQNCPRKCNSTCRTYGNPDCVEDNQCYPGCFCQEGYLMNDFRMCVPLEMCPPDSNPYIPTPTTPAETTLPASVSEDIQQTDGTTPTTDSEKEDESDTTEDISLVEFDVQPEGLEDKDTSTGDEKEAKTTDSASDEDLDEETK